jgi:multiple sugar transport system permease protein
MARQINLTVLFFLFPWLLGLCCFLIGPILASFCLAFTDFDGINMPSWIGLDNFEELSQDPVLLNSLKVTMIFAISSLGLGTLLAIGLALLLQGKTFGLSFYRTALYLPSVVPIVASSVVWVWVLKSWLVNPELALPALIIMSFWSLGNPILIYLAGLENIPPSLYESAEIDGANFLEKIFHITLPLLSPTIFFNVVIGIIQVFQYFVPAYVMTSGGPQNATMFYSLYTYQTAFDDFRMGYASALAWILFLITLAASLIAFWGSKRLVHYG